MSLFRTVAKQELEAARPVQFAFDHFECRDFPQDHRWILRNVMPLNFESFCAVVTPWRAYNERESHPSGDSYFEELNLVQEVTGAAVANTLGGLGVDEYFTRTDASGTQSLLTDALGSTIALVDAGGAVQTQYSYEPFGTTTATGAANGNVFQFTGRENDGTGLYYYRARYYQPGYTDSLLRIRSARRRSGPAPLGCQN